MITFPSNPQDGDIYPDIDNGDAPLENGRVYIYDAAKNIWNIKDDGKYVEKAGDTMTGTLTMEDAGMIETKNTDIEMRRTMPNDGSDTWDDTRSRYGTIRSRVPRIIETDGSETIASGASFGIEIDLSDRNTYRNELKVSKKNEDIFRVTSGANPAVVFNANVDRSNMADDKGLPKGVEIRGIPTPDKDRTPGNYAVNKEYVDQRDHILHQEIIELEEEIEALAPSIERGTWTFNARGAANGSGELTMYDDDEANIGSPTGQFPVVKSIWINNEDSASAPHGFANAKADDLIELFVEGSEDFGLYEIVAVHDKTADSAQCWIIDVVFIRQYGDASEANDGDTIRVKIFNPPSGGTASEFVKISGDDMKGPLVFKERGIIDGSEAQSMPTDPGNLSDPGYRAGLEIRTVAEKPIAISHDGTHKSVLDIYKYEGSAPNGREKTLSIYANGNVITPGYFQTSQYVQTPIVQSRSSDDLQLRRGGSTKVEIKSNIVEVNDPLQVNQYLKLVSDGSDYGKTYIYYKEPTDSFNQIRIQLNKKGSVSDSGNTGGGSLWYRRDGLASSALTWGKDGITLSDYADKKLDIGQCPVINVPDPVDEQDATNKRYVDVLSAKIEELEKKIANLGGGGSTMDASVQFTLNHRSSYSTHIDEGTVVIPSIKTKKIHVVGAPIAINSSGKINITDAAGSSQKPVIEYYIIKATDLGPNNKQLPQWELDVALATLDSSFVDYEGLLNNSNMNVVMTEGAVVLEPIITVLEFTGIGEALQSYQEDQVVETEFYRLSSSGGLQTSGYHYGNFYPYKYIENEKRVSITSIEGATAKYSLENAVIKEATFNGIDGISVYKTSGGSVSSSNAFAQMFGVTTQLVL